MITNVDPSWPYGTLAPVGASELDSESAAGQPGVTLITATAADARPGVRFEVDLADAVGYWYPDNRGGVLLRPDWAAAHRTSLVRAAPVGALYRADGSTLLTWAAGEPVAELTVRFGVSEERKTFVVEVVPVRPLAGPLTVRLDTTGADLAPAVADAARWLSDRIATPVLAVPELARQPVYSTWYTFTQDVDAAVVEQEGAIAATLGCGTVFIDDGWQRLAHGRGYAGCGDWVPDETKFPNLRGTIDRLRAGGTEVALWIAPLLLGADSDAYAEWADCAPYAHPGLHCAVLDPRIERVREHVAATCVRLVRDYGARLLKIDFLDQAMVYATDVEGAGDVGEAMADLLGRMRRQLAEAGFADVACEFRQPYVSPAIARYGQIVRAGDCPADAVANRVRTVDARLFAVGQVVHADPMMWGPAGGAVAVAQQLYAGWFAVPQLSMRLADLDTEQAAALQGLLALWSDQRDVLLDGEFSVGGAESGYRVVQVRRVDLGRTVIARYAPVVLDLADQLDETTVLNATPADRVVLRAGRPIVGGHVRDAAGAQVGEVAPSGAGLLDLAVPPYGSITLRA